jgi:ferric-dicitrate binding protein FerR (iron transport regulator)
MNPEQWRRESEASLERSRARRAQVSPHPFPRRGDWIATLAAALLLAGVGWLIYVLAWAAL